MLLTMTAATVHAWSSLVMSRFGRYLILGYVQAIVLLVGFLLLSVLGPA